MLSKQNISSVSFENEEDYHAELLDSISNSGNETYDWMAAKAEIDHLLQNNKQANKIVKKSKEVSDHWNRTRESRKSR